MAQRQEEQPTTKRGYAFDLVKKDNSTDLECTICQLLLRDAHSTPCHHAFCRLCLTQWESELEKNSRPITCPNCNSVYDPEKVYYIGMVDRMVRASVDVKCKQHERGCKWEGKIIDYKAHEETCQYVMVKCKNDGCHEERIRKNMKRHQQKCQYIIKNCVHCGTQKMFIELKEHYTNCPMMEITCTNDECDVQVLRHEMHIHLRHHCIFQEILCDFSAVGCQQKVPRGQMKEHLKESILQHQLLMLEDHKNVKEELASNEIQSKELETILKEERDRNNTINQELREANRKIQKLEEKLSKIDEIKIDQTLKGEITERIVERAHTFCKVMYKYSFSLIDVLAYWLKHGFQKKENSLSFKLAELEFARLMSEQEKLMRKNAFEPAEKKYKFISHYHEIFHRESRVSDSVAFREHHHDLEAMSKYFIRFKENTLYKEGNVFYMKFRANEPIMYFDVHCVDLAKFEDQKIESKDYYDQSCVFASDNVINVDGSIFMYHENINPKHMRMTVIHKDLVRNSPPFISVVSNFEETCTGVHSHKLMYLGSGDIIIALYPKEEKPEDDKPKAKSARQGRMKTNPHKGELI